MTGAAADRGPPSWLSVVRGNTARALATLVRAPRGPLPSRWRLNGRLAVAVLVTAVAIAVLMVFVDAWALEATRGLSIVVFFVFEAVTDLGLSGWFLFPSAAGLLAIAMLAPALPRWSQQVAASLAVRCGFIFVAVAAPSLLTTVVKRVIGRARPYVGETVDPFLFHPGIWRSEYASLPSGHATTAFAALIAIGALWPRLRPLMWAYALVIAVSRVVLHAHYPSDVLAGAIVGAVGALLVRDWFAARRLGFAVAADGQVRRLPGPSFARIKRVAGRLLAP